MKVEVVTDMAGLATLEGDWWDLFARVPEAAPFASPAWLLPWWRVFSPGALLTVAVRHGGRLVALAPLYVEAGPPRRLLPLGIGISDAMDVLVDPAHRDAAGAALVGALAETDALWDLWSAEEAPPGAAVLALPDLPGRVSATEPQSPCPTLVLDRPVPAGQRRKWRMAQHRAERRGAVLHETAPGEVADHLAILFDLHAKRWRERGESGVLGDPRLRRFHDLAAPALAAAGLLRMTVLTIEGRPAGAYYGFARGRRVYAYLGGFDPAFDFESPGTLLVGEAIAAAREAGAATFDFLRGQEAYKYRWGAEDRWTCRRILARPA